VNPGTCSYCGRPILWVKTRAKRKPMPLEATESEDGNVIVAADGLADVYGTPGAAATVEATEEIRGRYRAHFADERCRAIRAGASQ